MKIKRPFLKADLNSIKQPGDRQTLIEQSMLVTMAKDLGKCANINSLIELEVNLPVD